MRSAALGNERRRISQLLRLARHRIAPAMPYLEVDRPPFRRGDWRSMTERKPAGTSWETWIDAQIRVATEQGAFDNLPGAGKPLPNLDREFDPLWWVKQLVQREQISPMLPPSLELLRKVEKELAAIEKLPDEATVRGRVAALNAEIAKVNATVVEGPPTRLGTLDVDQIVARWQRARSATPTPCRPRAGGDP